MHLRSLAVVAGTLLAGIVITSALARPITAAPPDEPLAGQKVRIGVYDARAVAIAYVRANRDTQVANLRTELKAAEQAGDTARAASIRSQGERLQTLRHLQGFAGARVDDIMATLGERLPQMARDAGVVAIVDRMDWSAAGVEAVDLTDRIVGEFNPDATTQKILADMRGKKPLPMLDVLSMKPTD